MLEYIIEIVARMWLADSEIRGRSHFGESEMEMRSRRTIAWLCGGTIAVLLVLAGIFWWWFPDDLHPSSDQS